MSLVIDNRKNKFGVFYTGGAGISTNTKGAWNLGVSLDNYDTYNGADLFEGIIEYSNGFSVSAYHFGFSHSSSSSLNKQGSLVPANKGVIVNSLSLNLNPGYGANKNFYFTNKF